jgi:hypothetical protein
MFAKLLLHFFQRQPRAMSLDELPDTFDPVSKCVINRVVEAVLRGPPYDAPTKQQGDGQSGGIPQRKAHANGTSFHGRGSFRTQ